MRFNPVFRIIFFSLINLLFFLTPALCQNKFEIELRKKIDSLANEPNKFEKIELLPNDAMQNVMTPSGFGGYGTYVFGGMGGVYPAVYTNKGDLIGSAGFCIGNSAKEINFAASVNITKVTSLSDLSVNFIISRKIFRGTSVSIGGLQLLAHPTISDAPAGTYYIAVSHSVQTVHSRAVGSSGLTYTIGVGNGRFLLKSPFDIAAGRGSRGTGVFASVSYEIFRRVNLNAEWTGLNFGMSMGIRPVKNSAFSLGLGLSDLTRYSSDKPAMMFSMGFPLSLNRKSKAIEE